MGSRVCLLEEEEEGEKERFDSIVQISIIHVYKNRDLHEHPWYY